MTTSLRKLFGTDGIRGKANSEPMTAEIALRVAMAVAVQLRRGSHHHLAVIGKDTRLSGYLLEPALTAGFVSMGMDVVLVGPIPTPGIAMLTRSLRADVGVMISASHNPYEDNGIKLFGPDGYKLSDATELAIEASISANLSSSLAAPANLGRARRLDDASGRYIEFLKSTFPKSHRLDGLKIVIDCAHGAAYKVAPTVLWELGAEVIPVAVQPDGLNINKECGAVHPLHLQEQVVIHNAHLGIALDGDADRLILVDEKGRVIDGDQVLAVVADNYARQGQLKGQGVVGTVMSNLGLEHFLSARNIPLIRASVGDRYVVEQMRDKGCNVGGESSGHIVLSDYSTTGDGLMAALQVLAVILDQNKPASDVLQAFTPVPQKLVNLPFSGGQPLEKPAVEKAIMAAKDILGKQGRLLVRKSGTESVLRVMVECNQPDLLDKALNLVTSALNDA